jgi:hypothetical protein
VLAEFTEPNAPVAFPLAESLRVMPFAEIMPFSTELKLK